MAVTFDARRDPGEIPRVRNIVALIDAVESRPAADRRLAGRGQEVLGLRPLAVTVDGEACTLDGRDGVLRAVAGAAPDAIAVDLDAPRLEDVVSHRRTLLSLVVAGDLPFGPDSDAVVCWDHVLRAALEGTAVHEPGHVSLPDRLDTTFTPADDDADIAAFLSAAGFAHLRGWVDPAALAPIDADIDAAARRSDPRDPHRWWARLEDDERVCVRVQHFLDVSPAMASVVRSDAYERVRRLSPDGHRLDPSSPGAVEALRKMPGVVEGLADFPWHRDCSLGGHPFQCCGIAVGLAVRAATPDSGQLAVLAGSHRTGLPTTRAERADLPVVRISTEPGDLTLHLSCVLHRTFPPVSQSRSVVYTTWTLPPLGARAGVNPAYTKAASIGRE